MDAQEVNVEVRGQRLARLYIVRLANTKNKETKDRGLYWAWWRAAAR